MPKMAKNGQNDPKKINLSNDGNRKWTFSIISYLKASLTPQTLNSHQVGRPAWKCHLPNTVRARGAGFVQGIILWYLKELKCL